MNTLFDINLPGYAQLGNENFYDKEKAEIRFFMEQISEQIGKIPKGVMLRPKKNLYVINQTDHWNYTTFEVLIKHYKYEKAAVAFANKVEEFDWDSLEGIFEIFWSGYQAELMRHFMGDSLEALPLNEVIMNHGYESLEDMLHDAMTDADCPTLCPQLCVVEADGKCEHGFKSILLHLNLI